MGYIVEGITNTLLSPDTDRPQAGFMGASVNSELDGNEVEVLRIYGTHLRGIRNPCAELSFRSHGLPCCRASERLTRPSDGLFLSRACFL